MASFFGRGLAVLAAFAGIAAATVATTATEGCADKAAPASKPDPIVVGVSFGLTKDLDSFAAPLRDAVRAAEGEINAAGGLLGRPVSFDIQDDRSDEGDYVKGVANDFVKKGVVAVIGPIGSQQVKITQDIYAGAQIIQISPSATSTELATLQKDDNRFLYRTTPDDAFQGAAVMLFAQKTPAGLGDAGAPDAATAVDAAAPGGATCNNLAIVNIDNAYGNSMADAIVANWPKKGPARQIAIRKVVSTDLAPDYKKEAAEVISKSPQCVVIISYEKTAAQFTRDFKADPGYAALASKGLFFIGTDGVYTSGFLELPRDVPSDDTSPSVAEGFYGTNPDTTPTTLEYNQFRTIFASYFPLRAGTDAPAFAANTFDAAVLIAFAIEKAGSLDHVKIRDALKQVAAPPGRPFTPAQISEALIELRNGNDIDYKGASGNCDFEANGNVKAGFIIWEAVRDPISKRVDYKTIDHFPTEQLAGQIQ